MLENGTVSVTLDIIPMNTDKMFIEQFTSFMHLLVCFILQVNKKIINLC